MKANLRTVQICLSWFGVAVVAAQAALTWAQESSSITGRVLDANGAVVVGASVSVISIETGAARTVTTDDRGVYRALSLPVGQYTIKVEKSGFATILRDGVTLVVGQQAVLDFRLAIGQVRETISVTDQPSLINPTTSSTAGLVSEAQVKDLPLNGRSFDNLITLNPGTANTTSYRSSTSTGAGQGNNFSISGMREDFNIFLLNGVEYTGASTADVTAGGVSGQLLGVDAVREFNVEQDTYGAEYGKRPGGQVSVVTMSGTNTFHGTVFEFLRNSVLDARNYFDQGSIPPFQRNQFGGAAGGPILKGRTFLFGNYEGFRQRLGLSSVAIVPDDHARQGLLPNPITGALVNVGLAPGIQPYFSLWPEPNGPELMTNGKPTGAAYAFTHPRQKIREDFGNVRLDQVFSSKDSVFGAYTIDDGNNLTPGSNPLQQSLNIMRTHVLSLQETHIFSPSMLNQARFGFSRAKWHLDGSPAVNYSGLAFVAGHNVGSLAIGSSGLGNLGSFAGAGTFGAQQIETIGRNLFTYADDWQMFRGKHQISVGAWIQRVQSNDDAADQRNGVASFEDLPHFLQGQAQQIVATLNPTKIGWRQTAGAWYFQDSIKLCPSLTVSLGIRHEFNNGWNSPDRKASNFVFGPNLVLLTQPVVGTSVYAKNNALRLFGPRVGIAWSPLRNTVVHAGFGIYYDQLDYIGSCCDASPLLPFNNKISVGSKQRPATFPVLLNPNLPGAAITPSGIDPFLKMPTIQEYSLRLEQGITNNTVVTIGYVGSHGSHLLNTADVNEAFPVICPASPCPARLPSGTTYFPPNAPRANPNLANARYTLSNAYSHYDALEADVTHHGGKSLLFRASYAFSKSLDIHSSSFLANEGIGGTTTNLDFRNPQLDYGPSNFDLTHRLAGNVTYELPFGRGKHFLSGLHGVTGTLISGWQWNAIGTVQSGFPFTPLVGSNQSGNRDSRNPDRVSLNPAFRGRVITSRAIQWFNPTAFLLPAAGTFGNAARDILRGPKLGELDTSIFKTTQLSERMRLQFRAEFFNVLNHTNLGLPIISTFTSATACDPTSSKTVFVPGTTACLGSVSPSAGQITYTAITSRQLQFGLKLIW
jgi:hypothetical protein